MLHFFLPALAFGLIVSTAVDRTFAAIPATAALVTVVSGAACVALYRLVPGLRSVHGRSFGVLVLAAAFGNVTYLGLPVINEMLGAEWGYAAVLYDLLATTPILLTLGVFVAARFGSGTSPTAAGSLKRVLSLPPRWGVAAGMAVKATGVPVPQVVLDAAALMGRAVIPVMIFTVGLALDFRELKRLPEAVPALAIKMFVAPLLARWAGSHMGLSGLALQAATIEASMPVMVLSLVIADELDLDVPLAAACIAVSTVALFFTMPFLMNVLF